MAQAERRQEEQTKTETLALQAIPRKTGDVSSLIKTVDSISNYMSGKTIPVTVKIGNAKIAEGIGSQLIGTYPDKFITSVTKSGDLRIFNANAASDEIASRIAKNGQATRNIGNRQEAIGVADRLKDRGYVTSVTKEGFLRALDVKLTSRQAIRSIDAQTMTGNIDVGTRQEAKAVSDYLNTEYNGQYTASANDNGSVDITRITMAKK